MNKGLRLVLRFLPGGFGFDRREDLMNKGLRHEGVKVTLLCRDRREDLMNKGLRRPS